MFLLIVSLLDGLKLGVWLTVFMFGVCSSGNDSTKGRDLPGWCISPMKGKLNPGIKAGGQYMPRGFWDEAPVCCVLKVTCGGRLMRGSVVLDGLMGR